MAEHKKQSLLSGALILSLAIVATKIIGMFFKIYVTNRIGFEGVGYYAAAYAIYTPVYSIALAGLPTAVSKLVASYAAREQYKDVKTLFSVTRLIFAVLGIAGTVIILLISPIYAKFTDSYNAIPSVIAIAPSIFFCCVMSGYRGYYQGIRNMTPSAVSQVLESAGKLIFGWLLLHVSVTAALSFDKIPFISGLLSDRLTAQQEAFAAMAAIAGTTIGGIIGCIYLFLRYRLKKNDIPLSLIEASPESQAKKTLMKELIVISIPIAISALVSNLTTMIDEVTVQNRLVAVLTADYPKLAAMYPDIVEKFGYTAANVAEFKSCLYGAYTNVLEIKNIVPAFTITLGLSAIPVLSEAWIKRDKQMIQKSVDSVIRLTMLIALPAGCGMFALAEDILYLLFGRSAATAPAIPYIAPILMYYGISVVFLALMQPITNMLQAVDKMKVPVWSMAIGAVVKIAANLIFVGIPSINIQGAVIGSILCNVIVDVIGIAVLKKTAGISIEWKGAFIKPGICAVLCGVSAWGVSLLLKKGLAGSFLSGRTVSTVIAVAVAAVVYLVTLIVTRSLNREDVEALPKGQAIARLMTKFRMLPSDR